jgi:photosystem II stability/assembly factor-like uncharacterized protein
MCVAVGQDGVLISRDGGVTWTGRSSTKADNLSAVSCPSVRWCTAVGSYSPIVSTTDGGATWTSAHVEDGVSLFAVSCPTVHQCLAVGGGGIVLQWTDAGDQGNNQAGAMVVHSAER